MIEPYWTSACGRHVIYNADCLDVLPTLEAGSIDAVITDPPYGIEGSRGSINRSRAKGDYHSSFEDTPAYIQNVVCKIVSACRRLCGCVVVTPGNKNFSTYPQPDSFGCFYQPAAIGLQVFGNIDAQPIFYYGKNATKKNMGKPCSYQLTESPGNVGHPCAKPLGVWAKLVTNNTLANHSVLDPFMGSGTTGVACIRTGRKSIGIEIEKKYCDIAAKRMERELAQPTFQFEQPEQDYAQEELFV